MLNTISVSLLRRLQSQQQRCLGVLSERIARPEAADGRHPRRISFLSAGRTYYMHTGTNVSNHASPPRSRRQARVAASRGRAAAALFNAYAAANHAA